MKAMQKRPTGFESIDEYIRSFPKPVQKKLRELRKVIRELAPDAEEKISYQIPTFHLGRNLVHFAAYANHIGFYPTSSGIRAFKSKLSKYNYSKGAIQFPLDEPLPMGLIRQIVKFRVREETKTK
jgi:uncharacterized protein YdhG (YjbR/CyaY superfamily)